MDIYECFFKQLDLAVEQMMEDEWTAEQVKWYLFGVIDMTKGIIRTECSTIEHLREMREEEHAYENYRRFVARLKPVGKEEWKYLHG